MKRQFCLIRMIACWGMLIWYMTLMGCASQTHPDPFEKYNRQMFKFNMVVDKVLYRPIAKTYATLVPVPLQTGIGNVFSNINLVPTIVNDTLQLNFAWLAGDTARLIINTTLGVGGIFDVAKGFGLEKHKQDFGLTLARWGMRDSPYLILPLLPPGTPRDLLGQGLDSTFFSVWAYIEPRWIVYGAWGLEFTNQRAALLDSDKLIREAFDPYIFIRDAILQKRKAQIKAVLKLEEDDMLLEDDENQSTVKNQITH